MKTIEELNKMDGIELRKIVYELLGYQVECKGTWAYLDGEEWKDLEWYDKSLDAVHELEEIVLQKWKEYYRNHAPELCEENFGYIECQIYSMFICNLQMTNRKTFNITQREWFIYRAPALPRLIVCILSLQELEGKQ